MDPHCPLVSIVFAHLTDIAKAKKLPFYGDVSPLVGMAPNDYEFWRILGHVSRLSHEQNGTLLSALVVNAQTGFPGDDFCTIAEACGRDAPKNKIAREALWEEMKKVCAASWDAQ